MDTDLAFLSDELDLTEAERVGAANVYNSVGAASRAELMETIRRHGKIDGIVESALLLPLADYYDVVAAWNDAPVPDKPKIRRRKR